MKYPRFIFILVLFLFLIGCSPMNVQEYKTTEPKLDLFTYFEGKSTAYGQFQSRSGEVKRRFKVAITGTVEGKILTLDEQFVYDDGQTEERIWVIERLAENSYKGTAGDVVGPAYGKSAGAAFNWQYTLDLPYKNSSIHVKFDDWMFLQTDKVMLNKAKVTKWGFTVGEVTLFFTKD